MSLPTDIQRSIDTNARLERNHRKLTEAERAENAVRNLPGFFTDLIANAGEAKATQARMSNDGVGVIGVHTRDESNAAVINLSTNPSGSAARAASTFSDYGPLPVRGGPTVQAASYHAALIQHSRLATLGMGSILRKPPMQMKPLGTGADVPALSHDVSGLSHMTPLDFTAVADGANSVPGTALPWVTDTVEWDDPSQAPRYMLSLKLTHATYRAAMEAGTLDERLMAAALIGLGRLNDRVMLQALGLLHPTTNPGDTVDPSNMIAKFAGLGVRADELGAVIGTQGANGTWNPSVPGQLTYANAIPAVMTDLSGDSWVGAWGRCATIWDSEVNVVCSKALDKSLQITIGASVVPLVPQPTTLLRSPIISS
jgi:hypothetical protein